MNIPAYRPDIPLSVLVDQLTESLIELDYLNPDAMRKQARQLADFSDQIASKARNLEAKKSACTTPLKPTIRDGCKILPLRKSGVQLAILHSKS